VRREVLEEHGLTGYPKTSGSRGIHIRTIASAYSVPPNTDACVSASLGWDEVPDAELGDFRLDTVPARLKERGDPSAGLHKTAGSLEQLLDLAARDEAGGLGHAPWPPHFAKQKGEPKRVQLSRTKKSLLGLSISRPAVRG
jgi:bifunctional non-homologous end joining protein LigD